MVTGDVRQRVLVVDDERSITDAVAMALRYEGFDVTELATGRAGQASAQDNPPDLIVLDVMLPDLTSGTTTSAGTSTWSRPT